MKKRSHGRALAGDEPGARAGSSDDPAALRRALTAAREELALCADELSAAHAETDRTREELLTANEALLASNAELRARNAELDANNGDLFNILATVEVPIVIVDRRGCIRRFTPNARPILNLRPSDVGRPLAELRPALAVDGLDEKVARVIEGAPLHEEEARAGGARWHRLQIRPYVALDGSIAGAVISVVDVHALKETLGAAEHARDLATATFEAVTTPTAVLDGAL